MENTLGNKIRGRRKDLGLTMREVAKKANLSVSSISNWEQGYSSTMRHTTLASVAKALDTTPAYLLGWTDDPAPDSVSVYSEDVSMEASELLRIYKGLSLKNKTKLLSFAYELEDSDD